MGRPAAQVKRDKILDAALALAESRAWEAVRLYDVAAECGMRLDDVRAHFREKENLVDAWFDRADAAMLGPAESAAFLELSTRERLEELIMTWLGALAAHRRTTRQMIAAKLEPGHVHIQIPAVMRISRTVQWMREAAQCDATYLRRAAEETALTSIYLATFAYWMGDESDNSLATRRLLHRLLGTAESVSHALFGKPARIVPIETPADRDTAAAAD